MLAQVIVPENVSFGTIDFEAQSLSEALQAYGVDSAEPTFFSWLGVTMYLTEQAVMNVLRVVAGFPSGSEIVFTFAPAPSDRTTEDGMARLADLAASAGEPWRTYFDADELAARLTGLGFSRVELLAPDEAAARYFTARADELPGPRHRSIVSAIV